MKIAFAKYDAAGNDFIVVRAEDVVKAGGVGLGQTRRVAQLARAILARHSGIGADGLFLVSRPADSRHHLAVRIFNADASEAEMSGNGIRCAAAWFLDADKRQRTRRGRKFGKLVIETIAGVKKIEYLGEHRGDRLFRVNMGAPILLPTAIPFTGDAKAPVTRYSLPLSRGPLEVTVTSMGNPHCSVFVHGFADLDWRALGREIERHPLFPNRTNVEFVRVLSRPQIEVRFWERGVGETASSGTGSSAAAVAAALNGLTQRKVRVKTTGGELEVDWTRSGDVFLTGPVRLVGGGSYEYSGHSARSRRWQNSATPQNRRLLA
jgi:diaminopimelate epimerase